LIDPGSRLERQQQIIELQAMLLNLQS